MGFRNGAMARIWTVERMSDKVTKARISINRRNSATGEYEQDFGGFVSFIGSVNANKALRLNPKDRVRLGEVDVTNRFDKEAGKAFTNFVVYSFELPDESPADHNPPSKDAKTEPETVFGGDVEENDLPF